MNVMLLEMHFPSFLTVLPRCKSFKVTSFFILTDFQAFSSQQQCMKEKHSLTLWHTLFHMHWTAILNESRVWTLIMHLSKDVIEFLSSLFCTVSLRTPIIVNYFLLVSSLIQFLCYFWTLVSTHLYLHSFLVWIGTGQVGWHCNTLRKSSQLVKPTI